MSSECKLTTDDCPLTANTDSIINNRVSEQTKHFTMESLILAQDER